MPYLSRFESERKCCTNYKIIKSMAVRTPARIVSLHGAVWLIVAMSQAAACDLTRPLPRFAEQARLLDIAAHIAENNDCRVALAPELVNRQDPFDVPAEAPATDVLDALSARYNLDWREEPDGSITVLAYSPGSAPDLRADALDIVGSRDAKAAEVVRNALKVDSPAERSPVVPRTEIGITRTEDEALRDYSTAVMRAPGIYGMASSDSIRGITAPRLPLGYRSSLISIDGIPLPAEANVYGQIDLNLTESLAMTRAGTGLGLAFGAGAGHIEAWTAEPADTIRLKSRLLASDDYAPRLSAVTTGNLGIPGARFSIGLSGQLEDESRDTNADPDAFEDDQVSLRFAWDSPEGRHQLEGSLLHWNNAQTGGVQTPSGTCGGGRDYCPAGADIAAQGGALNYAFAATDNWILSAHATFSDTEAAVLRVIGDEVRRAQPVYLLLQFLDLRSDWQLTDRIGASLGVARSERYRKVYTQQSFALGLTSDELGLQPVVPGQVSRIDWTRETQRLYRLPQAYVEFRYDDGEHWDASLNVREVGADSETRTDYYDFLVTNCQIIDPVSAGTTDCAERYRELVLGPDIRNVSDQELWLVNGALRYRFDDGHWLALAYRQSYGITDYFPEVSPIGATERIDTVELAWHVPIADAHQLELRLFRHDWGPRTATGINGAISIFDSRILGLEADYHWQPSAKAELWVNGAALNTENTLATNDLVGAPPWTIGIGTRYRFDGGWYIGANFTHAEPARAASLVGQLTELPARDLLDARVGFRHGAWDLSVFGTNLLNDEYFIDQQGFGFLPEIYDAPDRMIGIDVTWQMAWP